MLRYDDGNGGNLQGFELKRRGELKLIKAFQGEVFAEFLKGETLKDCYAAVGAVADRWLDLLDTQALPGTAATLIDSMECSMCLCSTAGLRAIRYRGTVRVCCGRSGCVEQVT